MCIRLDFSGSAESLGNNSTNPRTLLSLVEKRPSNASNCTKPEARIALPQFENGSFITYCNYFIWTIYFKGFNYQLSNKKYISLVAANLD